MRLSWLLALLPVALLGCGGSGGGSSTPIPTADPVAEDGTAQFKVDLASGKVKIQPIETGKSKSAIMGGSTVTFTTSDVIVEGGEQGRRSIKVSLRNNLKESIGGARPIRIHFGTTTPQLNYDADVRDLVRASDSWAAGNGSTDGPISTATSSNQAGCAVGFDGAIYVGTGDNRIRKILNGYVSTVATNCPVAGLAYLRDSASGREYLVATSSGEHVVRSITIQSGTVITWAGAVGVSGNVNGAATTARFTSPNGIAVEPNYGASGNIVVADSGNGAVRGVAFTFSGGNLVAGTVSTRFSAISGPVGVGVMADKTVVVSDSSGQRVRIFNLGGSRETTIGTGVAGDVSGAGNTAQFNAPQGLIIVGSSIILCDASNHKLKKIQVRTGAAPLLAANWQVSEFCFSGVQGAANGLGTTAQSQFPAWLALAPDGSIALTNYTSTLRRIEADAPAFDVGSPQGSGADGARLTNQTGYATLDGNRRPYIEYDQVIAPGQTLDLGQWDFTVPDTLPAFTFSVTVDSSTSVFASLDAVLSNGVSPGSDRVGVTDLTAGAGFNISSMPNSRLGNSWAATYDRNGNLYVAGTSNKCIIRFDRAGNGAIIAGRPDSTGFPFDGTGDDAVFGSPSGIVVDPNGRGLYVTDDGGSAIRFVGLRKDFSGQYLSPTESANWQVTTVVGLLNTSGFNNGTGDLARLNRPFGICGTYGSTLYFTKASNSLVSQMTFDGGNPADPTRYRVSTLAGSTSPGYVDAFGISARFNLPFGICETTDDALIVADYGNNRLRKISKSGAVTTIAGNGTGGNVDNADALQATLTNPFSVVSDKTGAVYFNSNARVRRYLNGGVKTVAGGGLSSSGRTGATRNFATQISALAPDPSGDLTVTNSNGQFYRLSRILGNR
jgi:hypothetical protein